MNTFTLITLALVGVYFVWLALFGLRKHRHLVQARILLGGHAVVELVHAQARQVIAEDNQRIGTAHGLELLLEGRERLGGATEPAAIVMETLMALEVGILPAFAYQAFFSEQIAIEARAGEKHEHFPGHRLVHHLGVSRCCRFAGLSAP